MIIADVLQTKGKDVRTVQPTDLITMAVRLLASHHIGAVVVEDRWQKCVGIFSERDLVNALANEGAAALGREVRERMSAPVITCNSEDSIEHVLAQMTLHRVRHVPVLEHGQLAGIVSIGDLVRHRLNEKELEAGVLLDLSRLRS